MVRSAAASQPAMIKPALKATLLVAWIAAFFIPVFLLHRLNYHALRDRLVMCCHRGLLAIVELRVKVVGQVAMQRPLLLVSNHLSYLDVPVLAAHLPVRFTPKSDIARWPVIGTICRITGCLFITRSASALQQASQAMGAALAAGDVVCLYPEATTGNGTQLLPFRSSFFSLAEAPVGGEKLVVQPVAIAYRRVLGLPIDHSQWPEIAWYGDMDLLPHLWRLLGMGKIDVQLAFLSPVTMAEFKDRKALAEHCQQQVKEFLESSQPAERPAELLTKNASAG